MCSTDREELDTLDEVNAQLAMYITELADELEEVKLFRDALLENCPDE